MAREGPGSVCCFTGSPGVGTVLLPAGMIHQGPDPGCAGAPHRLLPHVLGRERRGGMRIQVLGGTRNVACGRRGS